MAKSDLTLGEIGESQKRSDLTMSSFMQKQVDSLLKAEKILKDSKDIQKKTLDTLSGTSSDTKSKKDAEEVKKSMTAKTGDGLNSNIIKMVKSLKTVEKTFLLDSKGILNKTRDQREFKTIGQRFSGIKEGVKDFLTPRGFLDKTGIVKRGSGGIFSENLDAKEAAKLKAKARIETGERAQYAAGTVIDGKKVGGQTMDAKASEKQFLEDAKKEQALRRKQGDLERSIEKKYKAAGMTDEQISTTPEARQLKKVAKDLVPLDPRGLQEFTELDEVKQKGKKGKSKESEEII